MEDCLCDTYWPLWISRHAVWIGQCPLRIPGLSEWGIPGVPTSLRAGVHWRHPCVLPEWGRTLPARLWGPPMAQRTPAVSKSWEVHVPPGFNPVPRVSDQLPRYQDGRGEGWSHQDLAHTHYYQITPAIPRFFEFLQTLHSQLQLHHCTINQSPERQAQVSVLDTRSHFGHEDPPKGLYVGSTPGPSWPTEVLHSQSGCLNIWSWSRPVPAAGESSSTPSMCRLLLEIILSGAKLWYWNGELLAIKLTLEEWRHWLEGAHHPFVVYTDHRNLEYLREAKRLNPRQARWALFFVRFHFTISYRPGTKNTKADALSRLQMICQKTYPPIQSDCQPDTVVPGRGHRGCQCLWSYSAGVSPDSHLCPSQPKDLINPYTTYLPDHWSSWDQSNPLTATRSLLVAGNGQRHQKVRERMPGMRHGKDTPPLTIWEAPSSPHSSASMVTPRSRFCHRLTSIRW